MKIWAIDLKQGDAVWYQHGTEFRYSKVAEKDYLSFKMPSLIMENGDRIFVNTYCYTDRSDITDEMVDELIEQINKKIKIWEDEIEHRKNMIRMLEFGIRDLEEFKILTYEK